MQRYSKLRGFINRNSKSFANSFKRMSNKNEIKQDDDKQNKDQSPKNFMQALTEKFSIASHKVSDTFHWMTHKISPLRNENIQQQSIKPNINATDKPNYYEDKDKNPKGKRQWDTTFDINKMGGGTMEGQSKGEDNKPKQSGQKSKLDLKFGGGSSYGSSSIGNYKDQKPSSEVPENEKREYSVPHAGSAINESGSQVSPPMNEPNKSSDSKKPKDK